VSLQSRAGHAPPSWVRDDSSGGELSRNRAEAWGACVERLETEVTASDPWW